MRPPKLALATRCLGRPLKSALVLASQLGASGVQLDGRNELKPSELSVTGRRELLHLLEELNLSIASIDFPTRQGLCDPGRLEARIEALKQTMDFGYQLAARIVTVRIGGLPEESDQAGRVLVRDVLQDLARHSNRVGVVLAIGLGRESGSSLVTALREVTEGPIGVNFDPAAIVVAGRAPSEELQTIGTLVSHVMVRDAVRGAEMGNEVALGRGEVPWEEILALLHEMDYRGWFTVDRSQGTDPAGDAGRAIKYLNSIYLG